MTAILMSQKDTCFFYKINTKYNVNQLYLLEYKNLLFKILRKFNIFILGNWRYKVKKFETFIVFDSLYTKKVSRFIKRKNKKSKIIMYFWNPINEYNMHILEDKNIDEFWTFDNRRCKKI